MGERGNERGERERVERRKREGNGEYLNLYP